jgi:hypothetical protein
VTLRDVIGRLDEFADDQTIYAESAAPTAEAIVADEAEGAVPLPYLLEVTLAREAGRPGADIVAGDKVGAVIHCGQKDAWLPVETRDS